MEREPLGLTTWASHEAVTRNARQAGDRPLNTGPDPHLRHQSNLQMVNSLIPCALVSHGPLVAVDALRVLSGYAWVVVLLPSLACGWRDNQSPSRNASSASGGR